MAESPSSLHLKPAEWEKLRDLVDLFETAWTEHLKNKSMPANTSGVDPALYLPPPADPLHTPVLQELIRTDMEIRIRAGLPVDLPAHLDRFPELGGRLGFPIALLHEEFRLRRRFGKAMPLEYYRERFPERFEEFQQQVEPPANPTQAAVTHTDASATPKNLSTPAASNNDSDPFLISKGYQMVRVLGEGTFGVVYEARAPGDFPTAIKITRRTADGEEMERERKSLDVIRHLTHNNLLQVRAAWSLQDRLIVEMELASGTLRDRLRECQKAGLQGIPQPELLRYMAEAASAIDYLHQKQILHRDIKPDNILLRAGCVKVADFGLVRSQNVAASLLRPVGTPPYMGPEVWQCTTVPQSDQYGLACVYVELRCGKRPFTQKSAEELSVAHALDAPNLSGLMPAEQQVLRRALAKDPAERFVSCQEMVQALECAATGKPFTPAKPVAPPPQPQPEPPAEDPFGSLFRTPGSRKAPRSNGQNDKTDPMSASMANQNSASALSRPENDWRRKPQKKGMSWVGVGIVTLLCVVVIVLAIWRGPFGTTDPKVVLLPPSGEPVVMHQGELGQKVTLQINRQGYTGAVQISFDAPEGFHTDPITLPAGSETAIEARFRLEGTVPLGPQEISVKVEPGPSDVRTGILVQVLPSGFEPVSGATLDKQGTPYFSAIARRLGTAEVSFLLIRPQGTMAPFYLMKTKVTNDVYRAFAEENPTAVARSSWRKGGQAAGKDLNIVRDRLPVFRITKTEAEACAQWLGGRLPKADQLDLANQLHPATRRVINRWKEGPLEVLSADLKGIHDLTGNGREWTRDQLPTGAETVIILRGRSYASLEETSPRPVASDELTPTAFAHHASPYTSFRVVIELPQP